MFLKKCFYYTNCLDGITMRAAVICL